MSSLTRRLRARLPYLFSDGRPPPTTGSSFDSEAKQRRLEKFANIDPIHPDFLSKVDPLYPISEEELKANTIYDTSIAKKLHPHTAFGRTGFGVVEFPDSIGDKIKALAVGRSLLPY